MYQHSILNAFKSRFSGSPELLVRAPGRINLIGEHTDYNQGFVLPAAIDKAIWIAASRRSDGRFAFYAQDLDAFFISETSETVFQTEHTWANYLLGVVSEARKDGHAIGGLNLVFGGDVPLGAGLSSSAAIESGAIFVLNELYGLRLSKLDMIRLAQRGENHFVGMQCGIMDMFASIMGRPGHVIRLDCRSLEFDYFPFDDSTYSIALFDSGVKHALVDSEYNTRRAECEAGVRILQTFDPAVQSLRDVSADFLHEHQQALPPTVLKRCRFVVEEIKRVHQACAALSRSDFQTLGRLMFEGHQGLDTGYEVCVPQTNFLVEFAQKHTASGMVAGARQMGGGFGGCMIALIKNERLEAFTDAIRPAYQQNFGLTLNVYPIQLTAGVEYR